MGSRELCAAWGADSCSGMANVVVRPQYNDLTMEVGHTDGGRLTLMKNVMRDENILHIDGGHFIASGDWVDAISVLLCH
jgi:hypothetical protein